jgi:uncharacterized Tic20 family protein
MLMLILGSLIVYFGFSQLGSEKIAEMQSDYANFQIAYIIPILAMVAGFVILLTGILGFFTAMCRNSGVNCLCASPFIVFAFVCSIVLFVLAAITSGANGAVMNAKDQACMSDIGNNTMLADAVRD